MLLNPSPEPICIFYILMHATELTSPPWRRCRKCNQTWFSSMIFKSSLVSISIDWFNNRYWWTNVFRWNLSNMKRKGWQKEAKKNRKKKRRRTWQLSVSVVVVIVVIVVSRDASHRTGRKINNEKKTCRTRSKKAKKKRSQTAIGLNDNEKSWR